MNLVKEGNKNWPELKTNDFSLRMRCDLLLNAEKPGLFLLVIILRMEIQEFPLRNYCQLCWEYFSALDLIWQTVKQWKLLNEI